jgi:glycosyltransferase involved in cell wall biosynthesis
MAGIGQDKYISQLKNIINSLPCRKSVKLIGHQKDVRPWMRKAKALVVASYNEGFGRMTAEAAFCGCLVIGRNTGGTKEILNVIGGFPFENDDAVNGMYKRMDEVANLSDSHYQEMAERAQLKAVGLYSNESYVEKVYAVYQQLLKS